MTNIDHDWQEHQDQTDYDAGMKAYHWGVSSLDCPHPYNSRRYNEWQRGHEDGAYFEDQDGAYFEDQDHYY